MTTDLPDHGEDPTLRRQGVRDGTTATHGFLVISAPGGLGESRLLKESETPAREAGLRVLWAIVKSCGWGLPTR
ncbi:hypothetical protein [Streptomyces griseorubiginosus]|uniref:hypothetical protein n=1 Tax=Streptomyces griseorubiginosus TaxID=67304 RepID=UPI0036BD8E93